MKTNPAIIAVRKRTERSADLQSAFGGRTRKAGCKPALLCGIAVSCLLAGTAAHAQVNSGSNGSDGAFNPATNTVINMADHPDGIYHHTSVHIPGGVTVTFIPNANNTPVVWLVQSNCVINGTLDVSGRPATNYGVAGGGGGPGGYRGGNGGPAASTGQGPGGGAPSIYACSASYASLGGLTHWSSPTNGIAPVYGNQFIIPLLGGSGGGGSSYGSGVGGGGGGGAILIAASGTIEASGSIFCNGGNGASWSPNYFSPGAGSGGSLRVVASKLMGTGVLSAAGGFAGSYPNGSGGSGRVRLDVYESNFSGSINGALSTGFQSIIIPTPGQGAQLRVTSVGGVSVSASPTGALSTPDAVLSAQHNNPISIVVHCSNIPLNTQITVSVKPANGAAVSATGLNSNGTLSSSTATVLINMPRGGGLIYATAATGN